MWFTFPASAFVPRALVKNPREQFNKLNNLGLRQGGITSQWMVRDEPISILVALAIETRSHNGDWEPLALPWSIIKTLNDPTLRGIAIGDTVYMAKQIRDMLTIGHVGYGLPARRLLIFNNLPPAVCFDGSSAKQRNAGATFRKAWAALE